MAIRPPGRNLKKIANALSPSKAFARVISKARQVGEVRRQGRALSQSKVSAAKQKATAAANKRNSKKGKL